MRGFSLVELTVTVLLVGLLAAGALFYLQGVSADSRGSMAQEELNRIADEIGRWTLTPNHKFPRATADLPRLGGQELLDPWGTPYLIQPELGRVTSAGPDKAFQTVDDLSAKFAPARVAPPAPSPSASAPP